MDDRGEDGMDNFAEERRILKNIKIEKERVYITVDGKA
jgi:hypothetical protein